MSPTGTMVGSLCAEMNWLTVAPGTGGGEALGLPGFSGQWRLRLPGRGRLLDVEVGSVGRLPGYSDKNE